MFSSKSVDEKQRQDNHRKSILCEMKKCTLYVFVHVLLGKDRVCFCDKKH
jgi:hypothetical protein